MHCVVRISVYLFQTEEVVPVYQVNMTVSGNVTVKTVFQGEGHLIEVVLDMRDEVAHLMIMDQV